MNPGDTNQDLLFTVSNTGNGSETLLLTVDSALAGDDFDPLPAVPSQYFDTDASGDLSAGDTPYNPGVNDPLLAPDESVNLLLVNDIPAGLADGLIGQSELSAAAATGTGAPGDEYAGQGDGGVDAVVGASGAADADAGEHIVGNVQLSIVKSATIVDPFGGTQPVPGAQIIYTVVTSVTGGGTATNAMVRDEIPANTTFVPASIRLNGVAMTDAPDGDAGEWISAGMPTVVVDLGDLTQAAGAQTVEFTVTID